MMAHNSCYQCKHADVGDSAVFCKKHDAEVETAIEHLICDDFSDNSSLNTQVGGEHYKNFEIQPIEFIHKNNLSFCQGNVIKYITRYKDKNGIEDLKKAKHYIELLAELAYKEKI